MKKIGKKYKASIGLSVVILLFLTGMSYGAWSETLSLRGIFTTANFSVEFGDTDNIEVNLVTADANNIKVEEKITQFNRTENNNKNVILSLKGELINKMLSSEYMLQVKYPLETSEDSKIKAIKPTKANFKKPDDTVEVIPDTIKISIDNIINDKIDKSDYEIRFNIYRQIETSEEGNYAVVFLKAYNINNNYSEFSIEYSDLISIMPQYADIPYDNPNIEMQLEAEYSMEIPIVAEQFNRAE